MSTKLLDMIADLDELSVDDLLTLQERVKQQLETKSSHDTPGLTSIGQINLSDPHRPTLEESEAHLSVAFTSEQPADAQKVEVGKLQQLINDLVQAGTVSQASSLDTKVSSPSESTGQIELPRTYRRTPEEVEAFSATLKALLTPEEQNQMGHTDFDQLPSGPKSASEMLNEMREDRF